MSDQELDKQRELLRSLRQERPALRQALWPALVQTLRQARRPVFWKSLSRQARQELLQELLQERPALRQALQQVLWQALSPARRQALVQALPRQARQELLQALVQELLPELLEELQVLQPEFLQELQEWPIGNLPMVVPEHLIGKPFDLTALRSGPRLRREHSLGQESANSLSLYFDLDNFGPADIVDIIGLLSELYTDIGGDGLVIDDITLLDFPLALVPGKG